MTDERLALFRAGLSRSAAIEAAQPIEQRLAYEAPLAVGSVLWRAHDRARALERVLELEAADPRVAELHRAARDLRKWIAALLVERAAEAAARGARA